MNTVPQWQREFPDMADMPAVPAEWTDTSWHNDAMPSFERELDGRTFRLWVDYLTADLSEVAPNNGTDEGWQRFMIERLVPYSTDNDAFAYFTDWSTLDTVLAAVRAGS